MQNNKDYFILSLEELSIEEKKEERKNKNLI